jgi:quinol monooxygenase YgiN
MTLVLFQIEAKEDGVEELKDALRGALPDTRGYPGCYDLSVFADPDGKTFLIVETWDSQEAYEGYLAWRANPGPGFASLDDLAGLLASEPTIRYLEPAGL